MTESGSDKRYMAMFENSIDAILETVPDGRILAANPAACIMFGYTEKELCKQGRDGITDIDDPRLKRGLAERKLTGSYSGELTMIRKGGQKFLAHISSSVYHTSKDEERTVLIVRDLSEEEYLRKILTDREANLQSLIENTDGSIWTIDRDFRLVVSNTAFRSRFAKGTGKTIQPGEKITEYTPEKIRERWSNYYRKGLSGNKFSIQTSTIPPLEREYYRYNFNPIYDTEGNVTGLSITGHNITDLVIARKELKKRTTELQHLNEHLVSTREKELHQTAIDLHDDLGQKLTALKMNIAWLRSRIGVQSLKVNEKFNEVNQLIDNSVESLKSVVQGLRPSMLDDLGLRAAIEWLADEMGSKSGIKIKTRFTPSEIKPDEEIAIAVFRIVQEALTNILRHSEATRAAIIIKATDTFISLKVSDNGIGFKHDILGSKESMGLSSMLERARLLGGRLRIKQRKEGGTIISAIFKCKNKWGR